MSTPEAQRKARKAYRDRRKEAGDKLVSFVLSAEAIGALEQLSKVHGSKAKAVNAALIEAARRVVDADDDRELPPLTNAELKAVVEAMQVAAAKPAVQFGPTPRKPGDLAKKGKK